MGVVDPSVAVGAWADLLTRALDDLPGASVLVFDADLRFLVARGSALTANEYAPEDLEGRLAEEALPPARWDLYRRAFEAALTGQTTSQEVRSPDGRRTYTVRVSPVTDSDGKVIGGMSVATDVSALADARADARASEARFRMLAENASDVVLLVGPDGRFAWASPSVTHVLGWDPSDVVDRQGVDFAFPDDVPAMRAAIEAAAAGRSEEGEYRLLCKDGRYIWVAGTTTAVFDANGEHVGRVSALRDVDAMVNARLQLAASEERFRVVLDATSDAIMRFGRDLRVEFVNRRIAELSGISADEWVGKTFAEAGYPPERATPWDEYSREVFATGKPVLHEFEIDTAVGHRWFETRVDPEFASDGSVAHVVTTSRDVTERKRALIHLKSSEALLSVVLDGSRDGTVTYSPDLRMEYVNNRVVELSGLPAAAWIGRTMGEMGFPEADVAFWTSHVRAVFDSGEPHSMEYQADNTDGHRWYEAVLSPQFGPDGSVAHVISTNRDITDRVVAESALRELATHDPLTGLANRAALVGEIERALSAGRRAGRSTAVLMVDLDRFKNVNDSLGHDAGDRLLTSAAQRLVDEVRGGDLVGRTGGDEFVVVMRDLDDPTEAVRAAQRIVDAFRNPFSTTEGEQFSTASVGVAVASAASEPADLIREADTAMYVAKADGRDRMSVFNEELRAAVTHRLAIEGDLRHALERGQLAVWYQPEVDLVTGTVIAVEALLRWHHPSGELLAADRFVDVAEETGLILDIGDWVLREACLQAAAWSAIRVGRPLTVRVNVSALQLAESGLLDAIDDALGHSGLDPTHLCLEITETALLHDSQAARDNLVGIRDRGIRIAIDDFGAGYGSLTYLRRYPIDVLKIDRSFITSITSNEHDHRLVGAVIALANHLELSVTAEGVENEEQAASLRELGCPGAQGFLYSGAIPAEQVLSVLDAVFVHP